MTTITIDENLNITKNFATLIDLFNYINDNITIEFEELENQDNILKSQTYKNYSKVISKIK